MTERLVTVEPSFEEPAEAPNEALMDPSLVAGCVPTRSRWSLG